jgi:WD40 repeat protein
LEELAVRVSLLKGIEPSALHEALRNRPQALHLAVKQALADAPANAGTPEAVKLLLVVDQFEEIFALCRDEDERRRYIDALLYAVEAEEGRTIVLPTIRADFYGRCAEYPRLAARMSDGLLVGPMSEEELRSAIERPAAVVGLRLEPGLTDLILDDVAGEPGALPLLSHALLETFARRRGAQMTLSGYIASGGVTGAIAQTADTVYSELDAEDQGLVRSIFLRLTELGEEGAQDTRRRVAPSELVRREEEAPAVESLLRKLAGARLVTTGEYTVEVAHEALIREWPLLRDWLDEDREGLRTHRHLTGAAQEWARLDRDPGELYRGARLAAAGEWAEVHGAALNPLEREFLEASKELAWRREAEREAQQQRELEAARALAAEQEKRANIEQRRAEEQARAAGRLRRRALLLAGAMVVAAILAVVALVAFRQATQSATAARAEALNRATAQAQADAAALEASQQRDAAQAEADARATQQVIAETETQARATQQAVAEQESREALEAYSLSLAANARQALDARDTATALVLALAANRIPDPPSASRLMLQDAAFAPGPRVRLNIAETFGPTMSRPVASRGAQGPVALGPEGRVALVATTAAAFLYDTEAREIASVLEGHAYSRISSPTRLSLQDLTFSSDGKQVLSGGLYPPETLILWELTEGRELLRFQDHSNPVLAVDFSPNDRMAVSGGAGSSGLGSLLEPGELILWDTETGREVRRCTGGHRDAVVDAAFSPDGQSVLASSGASSSVLISNIVEEGAPIATSSRWIEGSEYDLVLWDVESCEIIHRFETESHDNYRLAIGPQGDWALTASMDRNLYRWDLRTGELAGVLQGHRRPVIGLALSSDGRTALSGDTYGHRLILWDLERGEPQYYLKADEEEIWQSYDLYLDLSPDAQRGISSASDGTLVLWDLVDARAPRRLLGHADQVADLAFTPDGQYLVSGSGRSDPTAGASADNSIRIWDVQTGAPVRVLSGHAGGVTSLSVNPDGSHLLSGSMDKTARLWDLETGQELRQLRGHGIYVTGVAFEPGGRTALSITGGSSILEWDLDTAAFTTTFGASGRFAPSVLALSPDGGLALSGGAGEDPINIWDMETYYPVGRFRAHEGADLQITALSISPDSHYALSGDSGGTALLWEIASGEVLHQLSGHTGAVVDASFGPGGQRALTCDQRGAAILWDLQSGSPLGLFTAPDVGATQACTLSPDGRLGAIAAGNEIVIWQIMTPTLQELLDWIEANRYVRDLTCQERELYRIEPLCEE